MSADNHPPPMPVRSPRARMARQGWAASSMIHPRARMMSVRKTPSPEVTISKTGSISPTVHPSPCGQHITSTMLPPPMPAPPSPCGAIRSPWRHPDDERGQPSATDAGTLTTATDGPSGMGSVFHDPPTGADGHLQEDTISKSHHLKDGQHVTDCQHIISTMPEPPSSSPCGAIRSPWRHPDSEGGQPSTTDAGTLTMATDGPSEMGSVFHDPPTGADGHLQEDTISKTGSTPTRRCFHL